MHAASMSSMARALILCVYVVLVGHAMAMLDRKMSIIKVLKLFALAAQCA